MTARVDDASLRTAAGRVGGLRGVAARPASGAFRSVDRLLRTLWRALHARPPSAAGLTDRQLADVGLTRADLPDGRGWRR